MNWMLLVTDFSFRQMLSNFIAMSVRLLVSSSCMSFLCDHEMKSRLPQSTADTTRRCEGVRNRRKSLTMVRTYTFAGMVAVTFAVITSGDHLFRWMAERQESKIEQIKLDRQAMRVRRDLLRELDENKAATA